MISWCSIRALLAIILSGILTLIGLSQTLVQKSPSAILTTWWFPLAIILKKITGNELVMLAVAFLQFPLFAVAFEAISRWKNWRVAAVIILTGYFMWLIVALLIVRG